MQALELSPRTAPGRRHRPVSSAWATPAVTAATTLPDTRQNLSPEPALYAAAAADASALSGGLFGIAPRRLDPQHLGCLSSVLSLAKATPAMLVETTSSRGGLTRAATGGPTTGTFATLDLGALLGVGRVRLEIGSVAASAELDTRRRPLGLRRDHHLGGLHLVVGTDQLDLGWARVDLGRLLGGLSGLEANTSLFLGDGTTPERLAAGLAEQFACPDHDVLRTQLLDLLVDLFLTPRVTLLANAQNDPAANNPVAAPYSAAGPGEWAGLPRGRFEVAALRIGIRDALSGGHLYLGRAAVGPARHLA